MWHRLTAALSIGGLLILAGCASTQTRGSGVARVQLLPPGPDNPRNSEGDFITLKDGRILFMYSHFTGGSSDHAQAHIAARFSDDGGQTWSKQDQTIVENEGDMNVMSVSLLRMQNGEIALIYLRKNSTLDCRPLIRFSRDEAKTWSAPVEIIPERESNYYVMNNDRVVQLRNGRLVAPHAEHYRNAPEKFDGHGRAVCYLSDDNGRTWRRGKGTAEIQADSPTGLQEPGVVELKDGRILMFSRTAHGSQYYCYSDDGGETWTDPHPSAIRSPTSPATIERIPSTGDLLLIWNDNYDPARGWSSGWRTPFNVAISKDEGLTWQNQKVLEDDPGGWYCYTALTFTGDRVLLGHCAGQRKTGGLNLTQITSFDVDWLYR